MDVNMPNWLSQRAFLTPNRKALEFEGQTWNFKQLFDWAISLAGSLSSLELKPHSRVGILIKNRPESVALIHALCQLGVEMVFLNHRLTVDELSFQLRDSHSETLLFDGDFQEAVNKLSDRSPHIKSVALDEIAQWNKAEFSPKTEFAMDDICSIMYTSGTTGKPKGVPQTYNNHWWSAMGSALNLGLHDRDAWLCAVPLFHISGVSILMRSVICGFPVHLMEKFDETIVNRLLKEGTITIMSVVTVMLNRMIHTLGGERFHPHFRCMLLGGGPAPKPLLEVCKSKQVPVYQTYGMTETASQIVTLSPEDSMRKIGSAGKPLFPCQVKIMADASKEAKPGETGEITVKGPNVTSGYLDRETANQAFFHDGWFSTGDLGYVDESGYLYVQDRRSDLIISGGENIYPAEIEEVLSGHEAVIEAGVTGVEDSVWGQVPYGFVVVDRSVEEEELLDFCKMKLASYKVPKRIIQIPSLPRNGANKLLRRLLREYVPESFRHDGHEDIRRLQ